MSGFIPQTVATIVTHELMPSRLFKTFATGLPSVLLVKQFTEQLHAFEQAAERVLGLDGFLVGSAAEEMMYDAFEAAIVIGLTAGWVLCAPLRHWAGLRMVTLAGTALLGMTPIPSNNNVMSNACSKTESLCHAQPPQYPQHISFHYKL